jgi:hypothetical protein
MKSQLKFFSILLLLLTVFIQTQGQTLQPTFSYKIELNTDGWYYASMKSDVAFSLSSNSTKISTMQYTLVAPVGTFAPSTQTTNATTNITAFEDRLPATNATTGDYVWSKQKTTLNTTTEYAFFSLTGSPILNDITAGVDIPLFRFKTTSCIGDVRMYRNVADGSGSADTKKNASPNSIFLSGIGGGLNEGYKANYGTAATCPSTGTPDLTTTISSPTTGTPNVPFDYTVTISNVGTKTSTGSILETISIPAGLTFNSAGGNSWVCSPATGPLVGPTTIICTNSTPNIVAGGSSIFPVNVTPTTTGSFSSSVVVSGGGDTNTTNNTNTSNPMAVGCGISAGTLNKI